MTKHYGKFGYKIPSSDLKYWMLKVASWLDGTAKSILPQWDKEQSANNQKSIKILGMEYREWRQTIVEMCENFIDVGIIPEKRSPKA
jgi:hypothetical protein